MDRDKTTSKIGICSGMKIFIQTDRSDPVLAFAAEELALNLTETGSCECVINDDNSAAADFCLLVDAAPDAETDRFSIKDDNGCVKLTGSNSRSVLFAVYRYLRELGFAWIRPGENGRIIPGNLESVIIEGVAIREQASYRYRTICIEGACSFEHVRDLLDWGTKHFLNGYFIQFDYGTCFWERWYKHEGSTCWEGKDDFSVKDAELIVARLIPEINKRGIFLERMGHDWTCRALGVTGEGWNCQEVALTDEQRSMLAEVNGKRELWHKIALNTNLCYSSPVVKKRLVDEVTEYALAHPEVELLHFWLADGSNNHCECSACRDIRPADLYVDILNEIDRSLTALNLETRIVFLIYVDLLWPPEKSRIINQKRFVLMFAPISRSYLHSFDEATVATGSLPCYEKNKLDFPSDVGVNLQFLGEWRKMFQGDCFDFDYHMLWAYNYDLSNVSLAKVLHRDLRHLSLMNMHGFNSCQIQRLSFPHNLMLDVFADTLWQRDQEFEFIFRKSMRSTFGSGAEEVGHFFSEVSRLWLPFFEPVHIPEKDEVRIAKGLENIVKIRELMTEMKVDVAADRTAEPDAVRQSWRYLEYYLKLLELLLPAFEAYFNADEKLCRAKFEEAFNWLWRQERELHPVLDVFELVHVLKWRVNELLQDGQIGVL